MDTIYDYMEGVGYVGRHQYDSDGVEFDVNMILPTSSHAMERFDLEEEAQTMYTNLVMFYSVSYRGAECYNNIYVGHSWAPEWQYAVE